MGNPRRKSRKMILIRALLLYISYNVRSIMKEISNSWTSIFDSAAYPGSSTLRIISKNDIPENNRRIFPLLCTLLVRTFICTLYYLHRWEHGGVKKIDSTVYPGSGTSQCAVGSGGAIKFARRQVEIFVTVSQKEGLSPPLFGTPP